MNNKNYLNIVEEIIKYEKELDIINDIIFSINTIFSEHMLMYNNERENRYQFIKNILIYIKNAQLSWDDLSKVEHRISQHVKYTLQPNEKVDDLIFFILNEKFKLEDNIQLLKIQLIE